MRVLAGLGALVALSACALPLNREFASHPQSVAHDPARPELALLEYRLARHFASDKAIITCAAVRRNDRDSYGLAQSDKLSPLAPEVEAELLGRFAGLSPFARCRFDGAEVVDAQTGGPAIFFDYHELECEKPTLCAAWTGYYGGLKVNGWNYFELTFARGMWEIREKDLGIVLTAIHPPSSDAVAG